MQSLLKDAAATVKIMRLVSIYLLLLLIGEIGLAQVASFKAYGPGGGGAMFAPSIDPHDDDHFFVASDMSPLFETHNYGKSYQTVAAQVFQSGVYSRIGFTNNSNTCYAIDYTGDIAKGVKSINQGSSWQEMQGTNAINDALLFLKPNYHNSLQLLVATYDRLYFSNDGGVSFSSVHQAANASIGLVVGGAFYEGANIYVGTNDGLLISNDSGASFSIESFTGIPSGKSIYALAGAHERDTTRLYVIVANSNDLYAGIGGQDYWQLYKGIYALDIGSTSWQYKSSGIAPNLEFLMMLDCKPTDIDTIYAAGSNDIAMPNVFRSTNGGNNWTKNFFALNNQNVNTGWCGQGGDRGWSYAECVFGLAVSPVNSSKVVITDYGFVHTTANGGNSWQQAYVDSTTANSANVNITPGSAYKSSGLENTSCWQLFWASNNTIIGAYSDIKMSLSKDAGQTWSFNYSGHTENTMYRVVKNISSNTLYAATSSIHDLYQSTRLQDAILDDASATGRILFSTNQGSSWQVMKDFGHPVYWLAVDPNNTNRMYASVVNKTQNEGGIWVSNNINLGSGATWVRLNPPGRTEGHPGTITVLNNGTVLCSFNARRNASGAFTASSGVFLYNPGLQQWSDKSSPSMFYWTKDVVLDPSDPMQQTWYAGVWSGWGGAANGLGGLYKTTDGGMNWTRVFNADRVSSCTFDPLNSQAMYITTAHDGLHYTSNINASFPNIVRINDYKFRQPERVFFNPYDPNQVWVTSFGNGIVCSENNITTALSNLYDNNRMAYFDRERKEICIKEMDACMQPKLYNASGSLMDIDFHGMCSNVSFLKPGIYILVYNKRNRLISQKLLIF
ncbi:MAG: hypothetical protein RIQ89_2164 [Bacteroidota bacterium]